MRIEQVWLDHFGKFRDEQLKFGEGIHVIYGPNESGKSTIHGFIQAMLFGAERLRGRGAGRDAYTRYLPWNGSSRYEGRMTISRQDRRWRIIRDFSRDSADLSLIDLSNNKDLAAAGKDVKKKPIADMMMAYGYIYVAVINMGANQAQTLQAIKEAEAYDGPSLIIAYAPCINHGIKAGMNKSQEEAKKAVASGYWNMLRFNPALAEEGKNPLSIDSKEATESYRDFIMCEVRYNSLAARFPDKAEELFARAEKQSKERYEHLVALKDSYGKDE